VHPKADEQPAQSAGRNQTITKRVMKKLKTKIPEMLRRNGPVVKSVESVLRPEDMSMVGKICERGRSCAGSERERELWMARVVS